MTTHAWADSATMFRRSLLHIRRYPSMTVLLVGMPVVFLLLFVYVFGGTMGHGLATLAGTAQQGRAAYLAYIVPGLLTMALAAAAQGTAVSVAMDMTEGIIARFRTMPIARSSVLTGHVLGSLVQAAICVASVIGVALACGYRPTASAEAWMGTLGILVAAAFALTWLSVALGLASPSVESASNTPMFLTFLPFLGSGFVPTDTLPPGLRWFAEWQPFTPIIDTLRSLLTGAGFGHQGLLALGWCVLITLVSFVWARHRFVSRPAMP